MRWKAGGLVFSLVYISSVPIAVFTDDSLSGCFSRTTRRSVDNYPPIAEYIGLSAFACMHKCIEAADHQNPALCKSFTYDNAKRMCNLYDHNGMQVPAVLFPANEVDFFERISMQGTCKGRPILSQHYKSNRNSNNFFKVPGAEISNRQSLGKMPIDKGPAMKPSSAAPATEVFAVATTERDLSKTLLDSDEKDLQERHNSQEQKETFLAATASSAKTCKIGYYVVIGNQIVVPSAVENPGKVYQNIDQGDCANLCSANKGADGVEVACKSINYFPQKRRCEMLSVLSEPHGPGQLLENKNVIYAEKFCISDLAKDCDPEEVFILHVQRGYTTSPLSTLPGSSITACLDQCFTESLCRSVVFDSFQKECRLHKEAVAESSRRLKNMQAGVVLIENGCRRSAASDNAETVEDPQFPSSKSAHNDGIMVHPYRRKPLHGSREVYSPRGSQEEDDWSVWSHCIYKMRGRRIQVRSKPCNKEQNCQDEGIQVRVC